MKKRRAKRRRKLASQFDTDDVRSNTPQNMPTEAQLIEPARRGRKRRA